jgi:cold-inducible RNA-binding protein
LCSLNAANLFGGLTATLILEIIPEEVFLEMETELFVGNLSKATTGEELNTLFARAGDVTAADVVKDRKSGESRGYAFITMSAQNEADKAVSMFNRYALSEHVLKVSLAKPRQQRGIKDPVPD